jgi:hypothetical protein
MANLHVPMKAVTSDEFSGGDCPPAAVPTRNSIAVAARKIPRRVMGNLLWNAGFIPSLDTALRKKFGRPSGRGTK